MKRNVFAAVLLGCAGLACTANAQVVISQVYGGGNNSGATYQNDYVELRNTTALPVSLTGWSIQYASAAGSTWSTAVLSGSIPANGFFLVRLAGGTTNGVPLPVTADATGTLNFSGTNGKVALCNATTALTGTCPTGAPIIDFVGYGATANCSETAPTATLSNSSMAIRNNDGCTDTGNNSADFTVGAGVPRNSSSPAGAPCAGITDCNNNSIDDAQDILSGFSQDCNANNIPDECDIANGAPDSNGNGIPDSCESNIHQVIISEIVDGPMAGSLPKFVEITNIGTTPVIFGASDALRIYGNGSLVATQSYSLDGVTLAAGASYTVANEGSGGAGAVNWLTVYGIFNQPSAYGNASFFNGDDVLTLERNNAVVDVFGRIGEGAGGPTSIDWGYMDSYARRRPNVCAPSATFTIGQWVLPGNNALEATIPDSPGSPNVWFTNTQHLTNPNTHANTCSGRLNDCNGNGMDDTIDILGGTPDCNGNGVPDSCDLARGAPDCNGNGVPDNCDILGGFSQDVNLNGIPDSCESILFDCNNNGIEDATDISSGTSTDCDNNGVPDECQIGQQYLTDVNENTTRDRCEGAAVVTTLVNGTVQSAGVRTAPNGDAFFNIQGDGGGASFQSYGGTRFDTAAIATQLDAVHGAGQWVVDRVYLHLMQSNAGFSAAGDVVAWWTDNDSIDFTPGTTTTQYGNFATDFPDRQPAATFPYAVVANGDVDGVLLYDAAGSNQAGGLAMAGEIQSGSGQMTLLLSEDFDQPSPRAVAATYAGRTNINYRGPTLVVFAVAGSPCPPCVADFNNSGGTPDDADVASFFDAWNNGEACADANGSGGTPDDADVATFFDLWNAGGC